MECDIFWHFVFRGQNKTMTKISRFTVHFMYLVIISSKHDALPLSLLSSVLIPTRIRAIVQLTLNNSQKALFQFFDQTIFSVKILKDFPKLFWIIFWTFFHLVFYFFFIFIMDWGRGRLCVFFKLLNCAQRIQIYSACCRILSAFFPNMLLRNWNYQRQFQTLPGRLFLNIINQILKHALC